MGWKNLPLHYIEHAKMKYYYRRVQKKLEKFPARIQPWNTLYVAKEGNIEGFMGHIHPHYKTVKKRIEKEEKKAAGAEVSDTDMDEYVADSDTLSSSDSYRTSDDGSNDEESSFDNLTHGGIISDSDDELSKFSATFLKVQSSNDVLLIII